MSKRMLKGKKKDGTPRVHVEDVIKIYRRGKIEVVALRSLNCGFYSGEISVVMGPSGCGKTSLLNLIGGLDRPNSGAIIIDDENICKLDDRDLEAYRRQKIGYVFQFMNLIPEMTAAENIEMPLLLSKVPKKERRERVQDLLKLVGLLDRANHKPDELSGGEQQRIAIAAALSNKPEILLCDEPTGELDTASKMNVLDILRNVIEKYPNKVVIVVTHDLELKRIADRLFYIKDGQISHQLDKEQIKKSFDKESGAIMTRKGDMSKLLEELRELEYIIKNKIEKIEKDLE